MKQRHLIIAGSLAVLLPLLALSQEAPAPEKLEPPQAKPTPRLDLYGDQMPEGVLLRFGTLRYRHAGSINALALSPDYQYVAAAGGYPCCLVTILDVRTGKAIQTLEVTPRPVKGCLSSVEFSPDGKKLLTAGWDVRLWNLETGKEELILGGYKTDLFPIIAAFSPDARLIAAGRHDFVRVWEVSTGSQLHRLDLTWDDYCVEGLAYSSDGRTIVAATNKERLVSWDVGTGKTVSFR